MKGKEGNQEQLFGDSPVTLPQDNLLLLHLPVDVKILYELKKMYPWPKPRRCPKCEGFRLWGHGYSPRYFEGFVEPLWVKRYRCPECGAVHTCRPSGYFERYRYPVVDVLMSLLHKVITGRWLCGINRQSQLGWYRSMWAWCSQREALAAFSLEHLRQYITQRVPGSMQCDPLRL